MSYRSIKASELGIKKIKQAMKQGGFTQISLSHAIGISRSTLTTLFAGKSIDRKIFEQMCKLLELDWQNICENDIVKDEIEVLVKEVKQKIAADITERCGTMRVLDMTQPIDLDRIYTDVNIIKDVIGRRHIGYDEVMNVCTREHFDRFLVGTIQERVVGLKAVDEIQKIVVLGKPGAGKTTFMKYLAMSCLIGKFHGELVPIFVTLKVYAEDRGQPSLENYILTEFQKRDVTGDTVKRLLKEGRALILLDGLDEVKKEDDRRVKKDIDQFSMDWLQNRFAITCRIAAREYQFEKFTEVEVADFDDRQIQTFVNNWFQEKDKIKAKRMLERLLINLSIKELANSPLLLTLLCLVFGERNDFPPKRSEIYKEGLEVMMKKWDIKRNIEREQIYKLLSPQNKEDMLGQIAFNTFNNGEYFFRQEDLQKQIKEYICNLPEASDDPDILHLDSEIVLKAIEHHHGLLVERARNIYSFSHLTFQEYFTAREIERSSQLESLMQHIMDMRWKEVFLLTAEMLRKSDNFLQSMKQHIDDFLSKDEKLQNFLEWATQKTNSVQVSYKNAAMRSFYAYFAFRSLALNRALKLARILDRDLDLDIEYERLLDSMIDDAIAINPDGKRTLEVELGRNLALDRDIYRLLDNAQYINAGKQEYLDHNTLQRDIDLVIEHSLDIGDNELYQSLNLLKCEYSDLQKNSKSLSNKRDLKTKKIIINEVNKWIQKVHQLVVEKRNIIHDWHLTQEQIESLERYYEANLLLVECMNRSYVSKQVREEIESTMLLPVKEKVERKKEKV